VSILVPVGGIYFVQRGAVLIVMLGGGEKLTQAADIAKAARLAARIEE
jgi:putative addiction module killer protein